MGWALVDAPRASGWVKRFDPRYWTVDFARPAMASVTAVAPDALRVDAVFHGTDDLVGLIWEAADRWDHPLLRYETARDFRGCTLRFRWRSGGVRALDALHGPTLTIEGRDASGVARSWFVRLWNYAEGAPEDAEVRLDFGRLDGGFLLPGEAVPVWAGDVDRMFISLVAPGYAGTPGALAGPAEGWAELTGMRCDGAASVLAIGDAMPPEHGLRIATGYDDAYHLTPARLVRNLRHLGYREVINHYVGMSHYFRLERAGDGLYASLAGGALNAPCRAWHRSFAAEAAEAGYAIIWSLSYELFDAHCWGDWKQRDADGNPALTGWVPPSTLLSPAHPGAMNYLREVAREFVGIAVEAAMPVRFQVGEPWWWAVPDGRVFLYDDAARAALGGPVIRDVRGALNDAQRALLDRAGGLLAESTAALVAAVRDAAPGAEALLLAYLPQIFAAPELARANLPAGWRKPAFDVLQLEDYDFVTRGDLGASARACAEATARLGYPPGEQHYFSGFVLRAEERAQWAGIAAAVDAARGRGAADVFVWAAPQCLRDGFTWWEDGEDEAVRSFHDVRFPLEIGREASVEPGFSTAVVTSAGGAEARNAAWADARLRFDAGPGVRGEAEVAALLAFFRARRGAAAAFRFQDPFDHSSNGMTGAPGAGDQWLGDGDGVRTAFTLVKRYGEGAEAQERRITRPVAGSVRVSVGGVERHGGWSLAERGTVRFDQPPPTGAAVRAGYRFDVPVRFADDRLSVSRATFGAGEVASVPLVEVREA